VDDDEEQQQQQEGAGGGWKHVRPHGNAGVTRSDQVGGQQYSASDINTRPNTAELSSGVIQRRAQRLHFWQVGRGCCPPGWARGLELLLGLRMHCIRYKWAGHSWRVGCDIELLLWLDCCRQSHAFLTRILYCGRAHLWRALKDQYRPW
jgi:hypothetical protein